MPVLVRWYLKTALAYLVAALSIGIFQASGALFRSVPPGLTPVYYHLLMVGWVTQLILGVALWMFPKYSQTQPRGNEKLAWAAYLLLNLGLLIRAIGEPLNASSSNQLWGWMLVTSAVFQWLAGITIVASIWGRVKIR